jgi:hypothetical protein
VQSAASTVLSENYFSILDEMRNLKLDEVGVPAYCRSLNLISTYALSTFEDLAQYFWL